MITGKGIRYAFFISQRIYFAFLIIQRIYFAFLPPKRYNLLNDIINYTFSGVFSFFIRIFVPERV
mgnify:FL=1